MPNRFFVNGGVDNNWGTIGNWSLTSGGAGGLSVPTTADDVFLDASSPNCTVNASDRVALTFNSTGYTNTVTNTFRITVSGAITIGAGTLWAGNEYIHGTVTATHTSNGNTLRNFWLSGVTTHTLADNFTVGNFRFGNGGSSTVVNANQISMTGNLDMSQASSGILSGTTTLIMTGTGSVLLMSSTGTLRSNITFNTSGTITIGTGTLRYSGGTMTYTAGTVNASNATLTIATNSTTLDVSALTWGAVTLTGILTLTLTTDLRTSGLTSLGSSSSALVLNGSKIFAGGGMARPATTGGVSGTTEIVLSGTGTVNGTATTGVILNKITIDAGAGTITVQDSNTQPVRIAFGQLEYVSGTVITDNGTWTKGGGTRATPFVG